MAYKTINDSDFNKAVTLREAYQVMQQFVADYLSRGDTPVSDFLYCYFGLGDDNIGADPAALYDFLDAAQKTLNKPYEETRN